MWLGLPDNMEAKMEGGGGRERTLVGAVLHLRTSLGCHMVPLMPVLFTDAVSRDSTFELRD